MVILKDNRSILKQILSCDKCSVGPIYVGMFVSVSFYACYSAMIHANMLNISGNAASISTNVRRCDDFSMKQIQ